MTSPKRLYSQKDSDLVLDDEAAGSTNGSNGSGSKDKKYVLRLRDLPTEEKPREKLIAHGPAVLSIAELVAIILNVGTKKEDVLAMSQRMMKEYGDSMIVSQKDPAKVSELLGIPLGKACQLAASSRPLMAASRSSSALRVKFTII
jgi:DNA repair protein RadC